MAAATRAAILGEIIPEASGRCLFSGCSRSFSRSAISFTIYTTLESTQKTAKAAMVVTSIRELNRFMEKMSPKKMMTFLLHCFGRRLRNSPLIKLDLVASIVTRL